MRTFLPVLALAAAGLMAQNSAPPDAAPQMESLSAKTARPGDVIEINGVGLSDRKIDEVYLTDHKFDMRVKLLEQKETVIRFRVPPFAKPGRMQILALTKGDDPKLLEQPLYILIEDPATQVTQVKEPAEPAQKSEGKDK